MGCQIVDLLIDHFKRAVVWRSYSHLLSEIGVGTVRDAFANENTVKTNKCGAHSKVFAPPSAFLRSSLVIANIQNDFSGQRSLYGEYYYLPNTNDGEK